MAGSLQQGHRQTGAGPDQVGARRQSRLPPDGLQGRAGQAGEHRGQDVTQLIFSVAYLYVDIFLIQIKLSILIS